MPLSVRVHRGRASKEPVLSKARLKVMIRLARSLSALTLIVLAGCSATNGTSAASCVGPYLDNQPPSGDYGVPAPTVSPGATLTVYGHWYTSTCDDTGQHDPPVALAPVHLTLVLPDGQRESLGVFSPAGPDMGFTTTLHVPEATSPGTAKVLDGIGHVYQFHIRS